MTFMFAAKKLFIAKAEPAELTNLLTALNEAVGGARSRGKAPAPIGHSAALLERFFPEQMKKHKRALREVAAGDAPLPQAGHTQIMAIIDGKGKTPSAVGKRTLTLTLTLTLTVTLTLTLTLILTLTLTLTLTPSRWASCSRRWPPRWG